MRSNTQQRANTRSLSSSVQVLLIIFGVVFLVAGVTLAVGGVSVSGTIGSLTDALSDSDSPDDTGGTGGAGSGDSDDGDPTSNESDDNNDDPATNESDGDTDPPSNESDDNNDDDNNDDDNNDDDNNDDDNNDDDNNDDETHTLTVEVVDQDGDPVPGADVTVTSGSGDSETGETGMDGEAEFIGPNGDYTISATAEGYTPGTGNAKIDDGDESTEVTLEEEEAETYSIGGTVTNESDEPIDSATVTITGNGVDEEVTVDDDGSFEKENLEKGEYTVTANADGYQENSEPVTIEDSDKDNIELPLEKEGDDDDGGGIFSPYQISN
ncbi:carboxypeptidase regulatory-like domain-containing protein [Natrinema halophilum]|uniref:Carboxypeptidase regulatory-like domain-containing protein n=1 Tax=Natrinema halophilum TaxID=1699371 RepID=A0A7D5GJM5_9EURY|nr:carboxypeptidase regulatory-like domain-containing protein [Natrinema halophilum]QLG50768.1 carboxypeptidase-like regulatory domain-containing protein [Natrinema halophilum]